MFPIFDLNGQVVGFAGRVAPGGDEKSAKYVNTPQTLIYDKGRLLYGLDKAKIEIKRKNFCVLVEGNTDVIMSHQAGVFNVVASSGTALTEEHLKIIKRYTDNLVLAFDTDLAGINATKRTANLALSQGFNAKIIVTPSGKRIKDPADLIRENPRAWEKIISSAQGIIEFCLSDALARHDIKTANGKKEAAKELLPLFKKIADPIEQAHWIGELAKKLRVAEKLLSEALNKISSPRETLQTQNKTQTIKTNQPKSRRLRLEEELIGSIVGTSEPKEAINEILKWQNINKIENVFNAPHTKNIFKNLAQHLQKSQITDKINLTKLQSGLLPEQTIYLNQIILIAEIRQIDPQKHAEHINSCLTSLKKEIIREKMEKLQYEIKNLEDKNDRKKLFNLLDKFKSLSQQLIT
jgi:DNA primase